MILTFSSRWTILFGKTVENVRKHRDIKLVKTVKRRNYLTSEPNWYTKRPLGKQKVTIKNKWNKYQNDQAIIFISINSGDKQDSYVWVLVWLCKNKVRRQRNVKSGDVYADLAEHIETRFDTFNYKAERPLPINKNETVIGLI